MHEWDSVAYSEKTFALKKLSILSDPKRICHTIIYFLANRPGSLRKWFAFSNTKLSFLALPTHPAVLSQVLTYVSSQGAGHGSGWKGKNKTQKVSSQVSSQGWFLVQLHNSRARSRSGVRGMKGVSVLWCGNHQAAVHFYHGSSWFRALGMTPSRISWSECMGQFCWCFWATWLFSAVSGSRSSRGCCLWLQTTYFADTANTLSCCCVFPPPYLPYVFIDSLGWL